MKNKVLGLLYITVLTMTASVIAYESWGNAIGYSHSVNKITEKLQVEENLKNSGKKLLEKITFNWYDGYTESVNEIKELKLKSDKYNNSSYRFSKAYLGLVLLSIILYMVGKNRALLSGLVILSIIALVTGWFSPILEITAYQEIPVLGNTIFQYESKSIISALYKIIDNKQYVIAGIIMLFTVITPIMKTLLLLIMSIKERLYLSRKTINILSLIGKWSMLDVFVVAIVVTYFSLKATGKTDANIQIGVYYFSIYVILSMICTYIISIKSNQDQKA